MTSATTRSTAEELWTCLAGEDADEAVFSVLNLDHDRFLTDLALHPGVVVAGEAGAGGDGDAARERVGSAPGPGAARGRAEHRKARARLRAADDVKMGGCCQLLRANIQGLRRYRGAGCEGRAGLPAEQWAARVLQSAWRAHVFRHVFLHLRVVVAHLSASSARAALQSVNPREALLADAASDIVVRFSYKRVENNPWRPCRVGLFDPERCPARGTGLARIRGRSRAQVQRGGVVRTSPPARSRPAAAATKRKLSPQEKERMSKLSLLRRLYGYERAEAPLPPVMWGKQASTDELISRPRARTRNRADDLDDELPSRSTGLSTAMQDLWNDLPEHVKRDPTLAQLKAGLVSGASRPSELSGVAEKGNLSETKMTFPEGGGDGGGKGKEFLSNVSVAASLHASRGKHGHQNGHESSTHNMPGEKPMQPWASRLRMGVLIVTWLVFTGILMTKSERELDVHQISVPKNQTKSYNMLNMPTERQVSVTVGGALLPPEYGNMTDSFMEVWIELIQTRMQLPESDRRNVSLHINKADILFSRNLSEPWRIPLVSAQSIDVVPEIKRENMFDLDDFEIASIP
ncbi:hypothetical protein FOCC_FOCC003850, partial [Frankliniella occidentalis]